MNLVVLVGRITKDLELKQTSTGKSYTRFSVALDRPRAQGQDKAETDFIDCVAWNKSAEFITKYFSKGRRIAIEGSIRTGSYTNKDGNKVRSFEIWVDRAEFVDSKQSSNNNNTSTPMQNFGSEVDFDAEIPF